MNASVYPCALSGSEGSNVGLLGVALVALLTFILYACFTFPDYALLKSGLHPETCLAPCLVSSRLTLLAVLVSHSPTLLAVLVSPCLTLLAVLLSLTYSAGWASVPLSQSAELTREGSRTSPSS